MRLTRLEIFGFKSFVDRFVLNFDRNLVGVVGPNGCGKSNIVDSLRWVLGETHAKQLRGGVLEDLIFNGSDSRRPLGMAEVSITVRPHEGWAPATVLRLQELAKSDSGALDSDPQTNAEATTEGDAELAAELPGPSEFEGANGRATTATTLLQLPGLFDASEVQLTRRLYRSGESEYFINRVPCRLRDMIEFYRLIGLGSRGLSIVQQGQVGDIISRKPEELRELLEEAAGISGFRARIATAERKVEKTIENLSRLKDLTNEIEKQVRTLSRQAKRAKERGILREELRHQEVSLYQLRGALILRREELETTELSAKENELHQLQSTLEDLAAELRDATGDAESFETSLRELREKREGLLTEVRKRQQREQELRLSLSRLESRLKGNRFQLQETSDWGTRIDSELAGFREKLRAEEDRLSESEGRRKGIEDLLAQLVQRAGSELSDERNQIRAAIENCRTKLAELPNLREAQQKFDVDLRTFGSEERQLLQRISAKRSELASCAGQRSAVEEQLSDLSRSVEEGILGTGEGGREEAGEVLLRGLRTPDGLESAVAAILGEKGRYLVTDRGEELLERFDSGAKSRRALGVISASGPKAAEGSPREDALLLKQLQIEPWAEAAANAVLQNVYFTETLEEARALRVELGASATVVTRGGVVLAPWGWFTSGETGIQSFRLTRLLEEQRQLGARLEAEATALDAEHHTHRARIEEAERSRGEIHRRIAELDQISHELRGLESQERKAEADEREARLREERRMQDDLRQASIALSSVESAVRHLREGIAHRESEISRASQKSEAISHEWHTLCAEYETLRGSLREESGAELPEAAEQFLTAPNIEFHLHADSAAESELLSLEGLLGERDAELRKKRKALQEKSEQKERAASDLSARSMEIQDLRLKGERYRVERDLLKEEVLQKFGPDFEFALQEEAEDLEIGALEHRYEQVSEKVRQIRNRLEEDGEIDPAVIEEHERERIRLATLRTQIEDLEGAQKTLERTIRHLRELSRQRFLETFEDVSARFAILVPRLFGGGSGQMILSNADDPLTTGVVVTVRPPGKKLRLLELLSGGEKALSATAILLAMFLHRPSPICVLDEVDAPLDDANLDRFLNLIREISETTQMLIITHNKMTMLASDRLIGITMQEAGISKALSVTFDEAIEELERVAANG